MSMRMGGGKETEVLGELLDKYGPTEIVGAMQSMIACSGSGFAAEGYLRLGKQMLDASAVLSRCFDKLKEAGWDEGRTTPHGYTSSEERAEHYRRDLEVGDVIRMSDYRHLILISKGDRAEIATDGEVGLTLDHLMGMEWEVVDPSSLEEAVGEEELARLRKILAQSKRKAASRRASVSTGTPLT
jgi:hypothetical protein